ncbi:3-methylcrotonyl-CoA carboxylase alpha subunit [Nocardioides scoriae]|uniref:3-methylcrotonyl-CoA carboxylase alpha subunit n=1 Tax=Nocardioides scoriae TaxID=642780 RepID=A0A1H1UU35_9ACTN|nr:biotin carboxylase N-terminal domain-containing protein [Nocardioides scoriae]SDS76007.1 3-methylcrotonyl-CoA carboxylase alpha subunit [Nocardioides scoriae]
MTSIQTVLIANRGEIALRVIRTCDRLGIRSVAIHTDLDATAPHVRAAGEAVRVGSYLDVDEVVAAAVGAGADAVHPGYGFLSERSAFAQALEDAGIALVGPTAAVMEQMGRKDHAREVAMAAGVPVVPSYAVDDDPADFAMPVLVKAAAGGGGKGMRVVRSTSEYADALAAARREAASSFGDDTLLVEKYVERGRHVEVQVLADHHGAVVHLFERDCSTQRRHQKVLEEAPAPTIDEATRERITSAAVDLAREVGYRNAGTVEFLLDVDTGEAYFLEMNTRLQVEHPVTEGVVSTGPSGGAIDLVEHQLRVAAGEPLALRQEDLHLRGHAIEARVYAEDSFHGFLPQAGRATLVRWPDRVRVDHALESGQVVSTAYDPMLGKVVAHGPTREAARQALVAALDDTAILGLTTNAGFLRALVAGEEFRDATIDTAWLDTAEVVEPTADVARVLAAWTDAMLRADLGRTGPFRADGFRLAAPAAPFLVQLDRTVRVHRDPGGATGRVDDVVVRQLLADPVATARPAPPRDGPHVVRLDLDGQRHQAVVHADRHAVEVVHQGQRFVFARPDVTLQHGPAAGAGTLTAPMPGTVLAVDVATGDRVESGARLGVLEAMKMELTLTAPFAGTVTTVGAPAGGQVGLGDVLFEVEADDD